MSVFDLEDGNPIVYGAPRQEITGEGSCVSPPGDQVARVMRPQSCLHSPHPQLPAQGVSFSVRLRLPEGENRAPCPPGSAAPTHFHSSENMALFKPDVVVDLCHSVRRWPTPLVK